ETMGRSDPLMRDALETILAREDFLPAAQAAPQLPDLAASSPATPPEADPALVDALVERSRASLADLEQKIAGVRGTELFDLIRADLPELRRLLLDPESLQVIMAGMDAARWLNERLREWLGEENPADTLTRSVPDNITSQMGLALLDVADVVREHPQVVAFLRETEDPDFLDRLDRLAGGDQARAAIEDYLDRYGMRCVGEIDITRPRWCEEPTALLPAILGNVDTSEERRDGKGGAAGRAREQL